MKKLLIIPLLVLALVLAACGTGTVNETPVGTAGLGTQTGGLATAVSTSAAGAGTQIATKAATTAATSAATKAATTAATTAATRAATSAATRAATAAATTQPTGLVAIPYSMLEVATMAGGATRTGAATGTPAAAGTPAATTAATAAATTSANATTTAGAERTMVRASELINSKVVDMHDTLVGMVLDVLADKAGAIQYVIVDATSFLGGTSTGGAGAAATGTPAVAGTPAATMAATSAATSAATTAATRAATAAATTSGAVGTQTGQVGLATKDTVLVYTGTESELKTSGLPVDRKVLDAEGFVIDTSAASAAMDAKLNGLLRLGKFEDFKVNDAKNDKLGDVKDLILDAQQGKLQYSVIDFGGFLGIGEQTVAVPWQRFTLNAPAGATANANLTLDVTEQTLRNAPKFDLSKWPAWPQPLPTNWENETRTFWQTAG